MIPGNTVLLSLIKCLCPGLQVPNIRFNVAKMLQRLLSLVEPHIIEQTIRPCLQQLTEDSDVDVNYYATVALAACQEAT